VLTDLVLSLSLPAEVVEEIIERAAAIALERLGTADRVPSPYMTIPEAADYLRCKRQRIDDLLSQRRLTRIKDGSRTLVERAEIERVLRRHDRWS
jgi:excisionase family DNA binding protein